jgi:hypothetical protein
MTMLTLSTDHGLVLNDGGLAYQAADAGVLVARATANSVTSRFNL